MKGRLEFVGYFKMKTGCDLYETDLPGNASVLDLIKSAEAEFEKKKLSIISDGNLKPGVLVFSRSEGGGMERINDLTEDLGETGGRVVLANLMGGG